MADNGLPEGFQLDQSEPEATNLPAGFQLDDDDEAVVKKYQAQQATHGTLGQSALAAIEGAADSATFGLAGLAENKLAEMGLDSLAPEERLKRREANPGSRVVGQIGGLLVPGGVAGKVLTGAGNLAKGALGLGAAEGIAARVGGGAVSAAVENALFQGGDEISKMLANDPNQSVETAATNVGLSGLIGGGVGGAIGAANPLWKASFGKMKGPQFLEDWKSRINWHRTNPEPGEALTQELGEFYATVKGAADEVYGPSGLKAQESAKLMPEMSPKIMEQAHKLVSAMEETVAKLGDDPLARKLTDKIDDFRSRLQGEVDPMTGVPRKSATPAEIFETAQTIKQELQELGKFNKHLPPPIAERNFVRAAKELSHTFRTALEDSGVWGKVGERQGAINKAFSKYLPGLKDFEKKFTEEVLGERVISPTKIQTFMNQVGKMNGATRREMLGNFIELSEKYMDEIGESHASLGIESPIARKSLALSRELTKELPAGAKAADIFVKKSLAKLSGDTIGAAAGAALGSATGIPFAAAVGGVLGQQILGDSFEKLLPAIAKPFLDNPANGTALKSTLDFGRKVFDGQRMMKDGSRALFKSTREVLPSKAIETSQNSREKLEKHIAEVTQDPERLLSMGGETGYYLPQASSAMAETAGRVMNYLASVKPAAVRPAPLDEPIEPTLEERNAYYRALDIAEKPLVVLQHIKDNTLLPEDVAALTNMYPGLYTSLKQSLTDSMIDFTSKGEQVPYDLRQGLSLFFGEPLDSTFTPMAIQAAQATFAARNQQAMNPQGEAPKGDTDKMGKMANKYRTNDQAAAARRATPA